MNSALLFLLIWPLVKVYSQKLNITISLDYTAAPGEDPGKLGPNEFTAGSILSLNCIVDGNGGDVAYTWSVMGNPAPPPECRVCNIDTLSTTSTLTVGRPLYSHHAGTYTCSVSETGRPDSSNSGDYTVRVVGAGIYAGIAHSQFDYHPMANNGLILSGNTGMEVNFISNSSQSGVGVITVPDGCTRSISIVSRIDVWRVHAPYDRPGLLRITSSSSPLRATSQGIYTATIPDSNNNIFVFNIGLYPTTYNVVPTISDLTYNHVNRTLTCESSGSPATTVSWMKDGLLLTTNGSTGYTLTQTVTNRSSSTYSNVLTVSETATNGVTGTYTCTVTNDFGSDTSEVVAIARSSAPVMFEVKVGEREVVFFWLPPPVMQHIAVITSYTLSCSPSPSSLPQSPSQAEPLPVAGFSPDTSYFCSVVADNGQVSGPPAHTNFTTLEDYSYFQLHLSGILTTCPEFVSVERDQKLEDVTNAVIDQLFDSCTDCSITSDIIDTQSFACNSQSPTYVTYRARLEGTSETESDSLISLIEDWVRDGARIMVTRLLITLDTDCSVAISSFNEGECSSSTQTETCSDPTAAIIGGVVAAVLLIAITLTIIAIVGLFLRNRHGHTSTKKTDEYEMVDLPDSPSSPVVSAIPTTTNTAYELMKEGRGSQNRHEYEMVGAPPAPSSPATEPLEEAYEIPLPAVPEDRGQPLPAVLAAKEEEEGACDSIPGDQ